jgi:hypothetical protein
VFEKREASLVRKFARLDKSDLEAGSQSYDRELQRQRCKNLQYQKRLVRLKKHIFANSLKKLSSLQKCWR